MKFIYFRETEPESLSDIVNSSPLALIFRGGENSPYLRLKANSLDILLMHTGYPGWYPVQFAWSEMTY